jgi:ribose transport system ATP-binding protein
MFLSIKNVSKNFLGAVALDGVSIDFAPGEIHALMGENGAGKSTLIKIITGVHRPSAGHLELDGKMVKFPSPRDALAAGIGVVHQERNLIPHFSVGENILLENLPTRNGMVDYEAIDSKARAVLDLLDAGIDTRRKVAGLSVAQMQLVEIAKALSGNARILLLDEPTASISEHEAAALFEILRRLRANGVAIVFVSHKLDEVMAISDRISVLRDGQTVASGVQVAEISRSKLVHLMVGREEQFLHYSSRRDDVGEIVLELKNVATTYGHQGVNLALRKGEILGLYGLVGAGRTELARAIVGVGQITNGEFQVCGQQAKINNPQQALTRYSIGYISEDRKSEGIILSQSIGRNIVMTVWRKIAFALGLVSPLTERKIIQPYFQRLAIKASSLNQLVVNLSGGNQQKVSIAKWLAAQAKILLVDEPTVGIDIKTKVEVHQLFRSLSEQGVAVLLISSDLAEMIALADRVVIMHHFEIINEFSNSHNYDSASKMIMGAIFAADSKSQPSN